MTQHAMLCVSVLAPSMYVRNPVCQRTSTHHPMTKDQRSVAANAPSIAVMSGGKR